MIGVIFDLDGTLVDSLDFWDKLIFLVLSEYNISAEKKLIKIIDNLTIPEAIELIIDRYNLSISEDELIKKVNSYIDQAYKNHLNLMSGTLDLLKYLESKGIPMAIATTTTEDSANTILNRTGILKNMKFVLTEDNSGLKKRSPDFFLHGMSLLGTNFDNTYVVEDAVFAMESASKAGLNVIGIINKHNKEETEKIEQFCKYTIANLVEIKEIL